MGRNIVNMLVSSNFNLKSSLKNHKYFAKISNSGLFDEDFYYHELSGVDSFNSSPGYMFVKK